MLHFDEASHTYTDDGRKLVSATQFLERFFETFDGPKIARRVVTNPNSKYHGRDPDELVAEWEATGRRARELGTLLHRNIQQQLADGEVRGERSIALCRFIEQRQPLLTLHAHVHESVRLTGSWRDRIGRTHAFGAAHDGTELSLVYSDLEDLAGATRQRL